MSDVENQLFETIDRQNAHESAHTRRTLVKAAQQEKNHFEPR